MLRCLFAVAILLAVSAVPSYGGTVTRSTSSSVCRYGTCQQAPRASRRESRQYTRSTTVVRIRTR